MITGLMALAELVGKSALRVPRKKTAVVVANLFHRRIAGLSSLGVIPNRLVGIGRVGYGLVGLEHPCWNRAEIQNDGMAFGGVEKINGHGINERKVP